MDKNPLIYLKHISDAINRIELFLMDKTRADFNKEDSMVFSAVLRELEVIGEAASHVPLKFQIEHAGIPWPKLIGMRHHLIHGYFQVDRDIVWKTVTEDIPRLKKQILQLFN